MIEFGGWDHVNKTLAPIRVYELSRMLRGSAGRAMEWVLDSMSAAAEAGRLDADRYIEQLFASDRDVRDFRQLLRDVGVDMWVNDRHRAALLKLGCASIDCATYPAITGFFDRVD